MARPYKITNMKPNDEMKQRKSPRAQWLEYNDGEYFVTVCTHDHTHYLGEITNGVITMTAVGRYLDELLCNATSHQSYIRVLQHVVMPNHFHAIIEVDSGNADENCRNAMYNHVGTQHDASVESKENADASCRVPTKKGYKLSKLSFFIGMLKSAVTRYARANNIPFAWQPRYHDHAMRNNKDRNNISQYIENNVANWEKDCFY